MARIALCLNVGGDMCDVMTAYTRRALSSSTNSCCYGQSPEKLIITFLRFDTLSLNNIQLLNFISNKLSH